jgi:topoisomerase-4 subunit A
MIYRDGFIGKTMVKRFMVKGVTRDKEYDLTKGTEGSKIIYFTANQNGEAEVVHVILKPKARLKILKFEYDFSELAIKGRSSNGNTLTKHAVRKISLKEDGASTLGARKIWFDNAVNRLNTDERGDLLGDFEDEDRILVIYKHGVARIYHAKITTHFEDDILLIEKYNPKKIFSVVYLHGELNQYYVKRFQIEETDKPLDFIEQDNESKLIQLSDDYRPQIEVLFKKGKNEEDNKTEIHALEEFITVKGLKARGKRLTTKEVKNINLIEALPYEEKEELPKLEEDEDLPKIEEKKNIEENKDEVEFEIIIPEEEKEQEIEDKIEKKKDDNSDFEPHQGQLFFD